MTWRDLTVKILLEPELCADGWYVKETWSGPHHGLGSPHPVFWGPMAADVVEPLMKERAQILEAHKAHWTAAFEQRQRAMEQAFEAVAL